MMGFAGEVKKPGVAWPMARPGVKVELPFTAFNVEAVSGADESCHPLEWFMGGS